MEQQRPRHVQEMAADWGVNVRRQLRARRALPPHPSAAARTNYPSSIYWGSFFILIMKDEG
eukprot:scaffold165484_cov31-Tisochrysis_lutea.AAC.4